MQNAVCQTCGEAFRYKSTCSDPTLCRRCRQNKLARDRRAAMTDAELEAARKKQRGRAAANRGPKYCGRCAVEIFERWQRYCPECCDIRKREKGRADTKAYRKRHREKSNERARIYAAKWRNLNPEKSAAHDRQYRRRHPERTAIDNHRKRARLRDAFVETVNPFAVFDRDGWTCQHCGTSTPKSARGTTAPNAPELDHVVPLAAGGEHSYANTQCLCRSCNMSKGAGTLPNGEQLSLAMGA